MDLVTDFDLSRNNTFGLASTAKYGAIIGDENEIGELSQFAKSRNLPLHIIGGGSNLVLRERVEGVVALMATKGKRIIGHHGEMTLITAAAGEDWPSFVEWTVNQGHGGLENLAGIPGTVGAAPVQNIGAYGLELADRFHELTAYDLEQDCVRKFAPDECGFGYRQSHFKSSGRYAILDVTFALPKVWRPNTGYAGLDDLTGELAVADVMNRVLELRLSKLPDWRMIGNAGSFFHNPVVPEALADRIAGGPRYMQADGRIKLSAAWLIDSCGLKGAREGGAGIYENHALIVVNHGTATFSDISGLTTRIQGAVKERFGVELVQEPLII